MSNQKLVGITIRNQSKTYILEKIIKYIHTPYAMLHVVSLNSENLVISNEDEEFQNILSQGDIQLIDGIGIALGCDILNIGHGERFTGVDLMRNLISDRSLGGLRVLLMGGSDNLAETLADCYSKKQPEKRFKGIAGYKDINMPKSEETRKILEVLADYKPQIIFSAFGSPQQEKWFSRHKGILPGIICVGVGGAFDFESKKIRRAPVVVRKIGFEWLFRLLIQPWRWRRQLRLLEYIFLVLKQKFFLD